MNFEGKSTNTFEILKTPEIAVQEEKGTQLFSILLKAENPKWGETETPLAKETSEYFKDNPLSTDILKTIRELQEQGVDEETLYNAALTYQHPERVAGLFDMAAKYKPHIKNPREAQQRLMELLESVDHSFLSSPLAGKFAEVIEKDKEERLQRMERTKEWVEDLIAFFKPDSKTTTMRKLSFVPTDPLYRVNSGRAFSFPGEQIIISHIDNVGNQKHEFLHGIINPIVEKLSQKLTGQQKKEISKLGNTKLKQDYGNDHFSLLCEELIRTYLEVFRDGKEPGSYEEFGQKISSFGDEDFQKELRQSSSLRARCEELGIRNIDNLKIKSEEYFERFEKNQLRVLLFELYQEYENRLDKGVNFEQFVLSRFADKI